MRFHVIQALANGQRAEIFHADPRLTIPEVVDEIEQFFNRRFLESRRRRKRKPRKRVDVALISATVPVAMAIAIQLSLSYGTIAVRSVCGKYYTVVRAAEPFKPDETITPTSVWELNPNVGYTIEA